MIGKGAIISCITQAPAMCESITISVEWFQLRESRTETNPGLKKNQVELFHTFKFLLILRESVCGRMCWGIK
jgi:hypothetical protein